MFPRRGGRYVAFANLGDATIASAVGQENACFFGRYVLALFLQAFWMDFVRGRAVGVSCWTLARSAFRLRLMTGDGDGNAAG